MMIHHIDWSIVEKVLLAAALGGIIGLEREYRRKPAGLRTNMFLCLGSAMFTLISSNMASFFGGDHTRIAAQIIPGIGFIGAGAILRERGSVVGLTTAATMFVVASIGMAVGAGFYATASFAALFVLLALTLLGAFELRYGLKVQVMSFRCETENAHELLPRVRKVLEDMHLVMQHFQVQRVGSEYILEFDAEVTMAQQHEIVAKLMALKARCEVVPAEATHETRF